MSSTNIKPNEWSLKFCVGDSKDTVLRKYIDLLGYTYCEAGASLFWFILEKKEGLHDYHKLGRQLNWCKLMKEGMPFKKNVLMPMCDRVLMICLLDFHENSA